MFGIDSGELLIIAVVALVVIGPKDLPRVMRIVGQWVARARGMARHFRSGLDTMIREAELEEMEKQWKANNERIMRESPAATESDWGKPTELPPAATETASAPSEENPATPIKPATSSKPKAPPRRAARPRKSAATPPIPAAVPPAPGADDRP